MADTMNEVEEKKTVARKKTSTAKKKTAKKKVAKKKTAKKKSSVSKKTVALHRKAAASSRSALSSKLKKDMIATLKAARITAAEELKLVKAAAKDEIAVLKDQLAAALKRERELSRISEKKALKMLAAGERWEKEQLAKLKQATAKARKKFKK